VFGANGVFEVVVDADRVRADRMHGYTSTERSQAQSRVAVGGLGVAPCPDVYLGMTKA